MKMKRRAVWMFAAVVSVAARAQVVEGENLLMNAGFEVEQAEFPMFWTRITDEHTLYDPIGGPEGRRPAVILRNETAAPVRANARQQGMTLVPGETYKLSAWIMTRWFKNRGGGMVLHNAGWTSSTGLTGLPEDSEWTFRERTFKLFPSKGNEYGVALYCTDLVGEIRFADVRLEAVSEAARAGSKSQAALLASPRLVPVEPLLSRIPRDKPELKVRLFGLLPEPKTAYECIVTAAGNRLPQQTFGLDADPIVVSLSGLARGDSTVEAVLRHRATRRTLLETAWPVRVVDVPAIDPSGIRQLNNLVAEVLSTAVAKDSRPQSFTVVNPRDGWIFLAMETPAAAPALEVEIDGHGVVIAASTDRLEAFRELPMGAHRVTVRGAAAGGRLVARSIPEIFNYPPCTDSFVKENGSYGWDFMKRHVLPAVTTLNGGRLPGNALAEAKRMGLKWLANFNVAPVDDPDNVRERMERHAGMTSPQYDGMTSDELFFSRATIDNYTKALWRLRNLEQRRVYTWIVGKPSIPSLHTDFMSACLNVSNGRGRLLYEAYCAAQRDEVAAGAYLEGRVVETMRQFNAFLPGAAAGTGMIFGNFNQIPIISLDHHPDVDFKYYLDMQVNLIANNPEFKGLATTGYWGTYYGDEELVRWSFLLMRHYAVEGRRDMLSSRYGFTYNPGLLANGDFTEGLDGWTVAPAEPGSIRIDRAPGYSKNVQGRWNAGSSGDSVCVLTRRAGSPNRVSQTTRGLEPGRAYCLQFVTAHLADVKSGTYDPRRYGIDVELDGAEIVPGRGFVHVDRRKSHRTRDPAHLGKINLHRVIFRARSPEIAVRFSDAIAVPGEDLMLNFVQLKPYLE